jgi:predicted  nucleic acid-binding Zn-ribbon protein
MSSAAALFRNMSAILVEMMENRGAIEEWRATLTTSERLALNHPTSVIRAWRKANDPPAEDKPERAASKVEKLQRELGAVTRERDAYSRECDRLRERNAELEEEVVNLRRDATSANFDEVEVGEV